MPPDEPKTPYLSPMDTDEEGDLGESADAGRCCHPTAPPLPPAALLLRSAPCAAAVSVHGGHTCARRAWAGSAGRHTVCSVQQAVALSSQMCSRFLLPPLAWLAAHMCTPGPASPFLPPPAAGLRPLSLDDPAAAAAAAAAVAAAADAAGPSGGTTSDEAGSSGRLGWGRWGPLHCLRQRAVCALEAVEFCTEVPSATRSSHRLRPALPWPAPCQASPCASLRTTWMPSCPSCLLAAAVCALPTRACALCLQGPARAHQRARLV